MLNWDGQGDIEGLGARAMDREQPPREINIDDVRDAGENHKALWLSRNVKAFAKAVLSRGGVSHDHLKLLASMDEPFRGRLLSQEDKAELDRIYFDQKVWKLFLKVKPLYLEDAGRGWKRLKGMLMEECGITSLMVAKETLLRVYGDIPRDIKDALGIIWHYDNAKFVYGDFHLQWSRSHSRRCRHALIAKYCQSGKTELAFMIAIYLIERNFVHPLRVFFITGFSDSNWRSQMLERTPCKEWNTELRGSVKRVSNGINDPQQTAVERRDGLSLMDKISRYSEFSLVIIDEVQEANDHAPNRRGKQQQIAAFLARAHDAAITGDERGVIVVGLTASMELQRAFVDKMEGSLAVDMTAYTSDAHFNAMDLYRGDNATLLESEDFQNEDGGIAYDAFDRYGEHCLSATTLSTEHTNVHICYLPQGRGTREFNTSLVHYARRWAEGRDVRILEMHGHAPDADKEFFAVGKGSRKRLDLNRFMTNTHLEVAEHDTFIFVLGMLGASHTVENKRFFASIRCHREATPLVQQRIARLFAYKGDGGKNGTHNYHTRLNKPLVIMRRSVLVEWLSFTYKDDPRNPLPREQWVHSYHLDKTSVATRDPTTLAILDTTGPKRRYRTGGEHHERCVRQRRAADAPPPPPAVPVAGSMASRIANAWSDTEAYCRGHFTGRPECLDDTIATYQSAFNDMVAECQGDLDTLLDERSYPRSYATRVNTSNRGRVLRVLRHHIFTMRS